MKKLILILSLVTGPAFAAGGGNVHLDEVDIDLSDKASLQRGARIFVNYCLSCHSAEFMRYNRMAEDLEIPEEVVEENLMFTTDRIGGLMKTTMPPLALRAWLIELENQHERDRDAPKYSSRTLDVDILLYDDLYLLSPQLEIPREEILQAAYVLKPLADLAPGMFHPVKRQSMLDLWEAFSGDKTGLRPMDFPLT